MKAFVFKEKTLYKALGEDGVLIGIWDFYSDKAAKEYIPKWVFKEGYEAEFVQQHWNDDRIKEAILNYEGNFPGLSWHGKCS